MKYVLDTNVVSEFMRGSEHVLAALTGLAAPEVAVPQPVWAELVYGVERLASSKRKVVIVERLAAAMQLFRRVPWDDAVSRAFGKVKAAMEKRGRSIDDFDIAIAAHALAHDATLVTANERHFDRIAGLRIIDWSRPRTR